MKVYDFDPRNLPTELHKAIGLAIASAAQTEDIVDQAIGGLAGLDFEMMGAFTTHMSMSLKFNILNSLAELVFSKPDLLAEFDEKVEAMRLAFEKRNCLAHDRWAIDPDDKSVGQINERARTHYEMKLVPTTIENVQVAARDLYETGIAFYAFMSKFDLISRVPDTARTRAHANHSDRKRYRKTLG